VPRTLLKRSKSSTVVVARSILGLLTFPASPNDAEVGASMCSRRWMHHGVIALLAIGAAPCLARVGGR
jgi:hypothetical protein